MDTKPRGRMCLIGSLAAGKTCLRNSLCGEPFSLDTKVTLGCRSDTVYLSTEFRSEPIKLFIDDTSGEERYRKSLTVAFARHAQCVLLCFDMSKKASFEEARDVWLPWLRDDVNSDADVILVGLKADLTYDVDSEEVRVWALNKGIKYFVTSAKRNHGIVSLARHIGLFYIRLQMVSFSLNLSDDHSDTLLRPMEIEEPETKKKWTLPRKCNC